MLIRDIGSFDYDNYDSGTIETAFVNFGYTYHDCYMGTCSFDTSFEYCPMCKWKPTEQRISLQ